MDLSWGYTSLRKYNYLSSSAYNVFEYSLSPFVLHIIMCMKIHCAKKERIWPNTGEMMTFIQQQMILLTVDTTQSYIQMATIHTCTPKCNGVKICQNQHSFTSQSRLAIIFA